MPRSCSYMSVCAQARLKPVYKVVNTKFSINLKRIFFSKQLALQLILQKKLDDLNMKIGTYLARYIGNRLLRRLFSYEFKNSSMSQF